MICIIALVVFGIMGIFSASHRRYAKEAFDCVFKRITLRKCDTGFDQKMKAKITGKLMKRNPKLSKFIFKNFEAISWVFTIVLIASLIFSSYSIYNLAIHGTCDPEDPEGCVFGIEEPCEENCTGDECDAEIYEYVGSKESTSDSFIRLFI